MSVTINGVTTAIDQADGSFTSQQNAQFIANAINSTANLGVTDVSASITSARLQTAIAGLDGSNSGKFTINGVGPPAPSRRRRGCARRRPLS